MKILVTNDDGIYAEGLWALAKALKGEGEVVVVAPDRDQSGIGASVTLTQPLRVNRFNPPLPGTETYTVEGTPADSVILALRTILKDKVDLVFAGINQGANMANDVFISGTVGAAFQAYFLGLPVIALSVVGLQNTRFDTAANLGRLLARRFASGALPPDTFLNINLPDLPQEEIKGIEITRLGQRSYVDVIEKGHDGKRSYYWIRRGKPQWDTAKGTDTWAVKKGKISIVPLSSHLTHDKSRSDLADLCASLFNDLHSPGKGG